MNKKAPWAALAAMLVSGTALAAPPLDSRVRLLYEHHAQRGQTLPLYRRSPAFEQTGLAPLAIRWKKKPSAAQRATYESLGFEARRTIASGATLARVSKSALDAMLADGVLARVSVDLPPPILLQPLDESRVEVGITAGIAAHRLATGEELDGRGVVVGDFDSRADIYHPAFFHAQAPAAWIDVDGDEVLTPGVDGVDLDLSGAIDPPEVLHLLNGNGSDLFGSKDQLYGTADQGLNPAWDYLYLDSNGDGRRNVGIDVPDAELLPTMGEPLYAVDDVDGDGVLRLPEKVFPLGEPKFRAVRRGSQVYRRGENLATFNPSSTAQSSHATSMLGAVAGGQPRVSRFLGYAPRAELLLSVLPGSLAESSYLEPVQWLADEGADVILTELGYYGTAPSDGSSELELLLDSLVDQGVVVVSPAGNLGYSGKHDFATIPDVGALEPYQNELVMLDLPSHLYMSVTWREGNVTVGGTLDLLGGDVIDLGIEEANGATPQGRSYSVAIGTTLKGAGYILLSLSAGPAPLAESGSILSLQSSSTEATAELFVIDNASSWAGGANFADYDVDGCMNSPALADKVIALSAYALHSGSEYSPYPEQPGAFRGFSGRGPTLWGEAGIDIAAPDNGISAYPDAYNTSDVGLQIRWAESGGTSGAGGAVAGMAALIKQRSGLSGEALRTEILAAARTDDQVTAGTTAMWGAGKLTVGVEPAPGLPPLVTGVEVSPEGPELSALVSDDGDILAMRSRWDFDYDGVWDREWADGLSVPYDFPNGSPVVLKVEVMDDAGWTARALATIEEPEDPPPDDLPPVVAPAEEEDDGCGCRMPGQQPRSSRGAAFLLLLGLVLARRRRNPLPRPDGLRRPNPDQR